MLNIIVLIPALGAILSWICGSYLNTKGSARLSIILISISCLLSVANLYQIVDLEKVEYIKLFTWLNVNGYFIIFGNASDSLSAIMITVVLIVSLSVHIYSISYMNSDPHKTRFMALLSAFTFCMLILVAASNFVQLFFGWEGVGICSYLLINFWYTRPQANKAAIKAVLVNRIGDATVLIATVLGIALVTSNEFITSSTLSYFLGGYHLKILGNNISLLNCLGLMILIGVFAKSAQFGLHTWLPDAMEGPTPVSALIHAATMVTAGVFLSLKCAIILENSTNSLIIAAIFGAITAVYAGSIGVFQQDIKKIIAYSTCSQLGYMVLAIGLTSYSISFYHLINHAFFKALLFLAAGAVIHHFSDEQDIRRMGSAANTMPIELITFIIASLALIGFPFLTGYYSKDLIIEEAFSSITTAGPLVFIATTFAAALTAVYSTKLLYFVFFIKTNTYKRVAYLLMSNNYQMVTPLLVLAGFSLVFGFVSNDFFTNGFTFKDIFETRATQLQNLGSEFIPHSVKIAPALFGLGGILYFTSTRKTLNTQENLQKLQIISNFFSNKWHIDDIYNYFIAKRTLLFSYKSVISAFDRGLLEITGPIGLNYGWSSVSGAISYLHTGNITQIFFVQILIFFGAVLAILTNLI